MTEHDSRCLMTAVKQIALMPFAYRPKTKTTSGRVSLNNGRYPSGERGNRDERPA
jgi:hypothetical protein